MTSQDDKSDLDAIKADPAAFPGTPGGILDRDDLSYEVKLDLLQRWASDLHKNRDAAPSEDEDGPLADIDLAIEQLQTEVTLDPEKPESAPSGKGYRPSE